MKKFIEEFKAFALRGNVMDMAIGVIIGGAFTSIVTSLTENLINPILGLFGGTDLSGFVLNLGGVELRYGAFITSIINFLIMAFVLFCLLKAVNKLTALGKKPEAPAEPTTKVCPFCCSEIPIKAVKCAHCGSDQPKEYWRAENESSGFCSPFSIYGSVSPISRRSTMVPSCAEQTATRGAIRPRPSATSLVPSPQRYTWPKRFSVLIRFAEP